MTVVVPTLSAQASKLLARATAVQLLIVASTALLNGCGGGGGGGGAFLPIAGGPSPAPAPAPAPAPDPADPLTPATPVDIDKAQTAWEIDPSGVGGDAGGDGGVGGTAGDGSPLRGVLVILKDATPLPPPPSDPNAPPGAPPPDPEVARGITDSNGRFLLKFKTANVVPPLVLQVIDAGGNVLASTTDETVPAGKAVRINVNPLTDKITSDVLTTNVGSTDKRYVGSQVDLNKLAAAKRDLVASTNAALGVAGIANTSNFDPVRSIYKLDGTGVDAVIESISHAREPTTGMTQLRAKLKELQTEANGSVTPTLITAATPLSTDAVAVSSNPALTFEKINAWMNEMNRCFALSSAARVADANCVDADGSRLVLQDFRENGKDLAEAYRTLFSESDFSAVQGSVLSNPAILVNIPASSAFPPEPESTIVEFTVTQPRTGPLAGNRTSVVPYTTTMSFVRTSSSRAVAGNWILAGNQKRFDTTIRPAYERGFQAHSSFRSLFPDFLASLLEIRTSRSRFDTATRTYVSANLRAARLKGPGLPNDGLVLSPSNQPGAERDLTPHNKSGDVDASRVGSNPSNQPLFYLNMVKAPESPASTNLNVYWNETVPINTDPSFRDTKLLDFSSMQAYSRYTIEYFFNGNATLTPDVVETTRILAPVMPPDYLELLPRNQTHADLNLFFAGSPGGCSFTVQWFINPQAEPVDSAYITDRQNIINAEVDALSATRPSNAVLESCNPPNVVTIAPIPSNGTGFRKIGTGATNARFRIYSTVRYN